MGETSRGRRSRAMIPSEKRAKDRELEEAFARRRRELEALFAS